MIFRVLLNFVEWESFAPGNNGPSLLSISSGFVAMYRNIPEMKSAAWMNGLPKQKRGNLLVGSSPSCSSLECEKGTPVASPFPHKMF